MDIDSYRCQKLWCWNFKRQWCAVAVPYLFYTLNIYYWKIKMSNNNSSSSSSSIVQQPQGLLPTKSQKSRRKISLPWFRQNSVSNPRAALSRQHTIDSPGSFRFFRQPSNQNQVNLSTKYFFFHFLFSVMESYYRKWQFMFR